MRINFRKPYQFCTKIDAFVFVLILSFSIFLFNCSGKTEYSISANDLTQPNNVAVDVAVSNDQSGQVTVTVSGDNVLAYHVYLGIGTDEKPNVVSSGNVFTGRYGTSGSYTVRVVAYGTGAAYSQEARKEITVSVVSQAPSDIVAYLTGSNSTASSKKWVWQQAEAGHLGVGPTDMSDPIWWSANPNDKQSVGCLYEDEITFSRDSQGNVSVELNNNGNTYFHKDEAADALSVAQPVEDTCYPYSTSGAKNITFYTPDSGVSDTTNVGFTILNGGFLSYFLGTSSYEILKISDTFLYVRVIQDAGGNKLAWYHKFEAKGDDPSTPGSAFTNLVWSDEFDTDGAPDSTKWTYDIGTGNSGWGNNELQYYTNRAENVKVEGGLLKITAKRETFSGSAFTSARIKSQGLYEFTYGKVEIRAKLPTGVGTWPALWMLGADFPTVPWPATGEIDIMEHVGKEQDVVHTSLHNTSSSGATIHTAKRTIANVSTEFHLYGIEWTTDSIKFFIDSNLVYTYNPDPKTNDNYPYRKDFFFILNVAMGGNFGGAVDAAFSESTMEVDYIRVYQ